VQKKKRIKTPAGRTDLPLVRQFKAIQAKASSFPSLPKSTKPKPTVKPTRKSFRIATQSTKKPLKKGGSSKQSPPVIEEIVSSLEGSPLRDHPWRTRHSSDPSSQQGHTSCRTSFRTNPICHQKLHYKKEVTSQTAFQTGRC